MTITLDFDGVPVVLTPQETHALLRDLDAIRRRLDDGGDASQLLDGLRRQVRQFIHDHVRRVRPEEIEVDVNQQVWRVTARRARALPS